MFTNPSSMAVLLAVTLAANSLLAAAPRGEPTASPTAGVGNVSVEQLAAQGAFAFKAGEFQTGLELYRAADKAATRAEDRATLRMNMGACLVELKRWGEAKETFLSAAKLHPGIASKAHLNAALVAVEMAQLEEAEALLRAAAPVVEALSSREQDIKARIAEKRQSAKRTELLAHIATAAKAIVQKDWLAAEKELLSAQKSLDVAETTEHVDVLHSLGTVQLSLERPADAEETLSSALKIAPNDPDVHYALARAHQALNDGAQARAEYRRALELGLPEPQAKAARTSIEALDPLSASEWFGWLSASGGWDSNPRQSGAATETTLGRRGRGGSAYGRVAVELGRTQRVHENLSLRLRYAGDWLGLQKKTVRELSLQNHGGFIGASWAPTDKLVLSLDVGASVTYIGTSPVSQFMWDLVGSAKARYRASSVRTWRLSIDARKNTGATDWEFLSGSRLDAEISHGWHYRPIDLRLGVRGRQHSMGMRTTTVDATVMTACTNLCDGAEYRIPLSYTGLGPVASARFALVSSLHLATYGQMDWRRYRDQSYIVGVATSLKRRVDLRYSFGADLQWALDENEHFMIVPSYALLVSSSNVAQSSTDSAHLYDYDDRSFVQHFAELGIEASF